MITKTRVPERVREELEREGRTGRVQDFESSPEVEKEPGIHILVPVGDEPECEGPIPLARRLASAVDGEICLLHVVEAADAFSPLRSEPILQRRMDDAAKHLANLESRFGLPAERTRHLLRPSDNVAKEIIAIAEREGIDLIVMTSHCRSWLGKLIQGSICSEVIRSRVCPVLCVPVPRAETSRRHRAMAATRPQASRQQERER